MSLKRIPVRYSAAEDCARPVGHQIGRMIDIRLDGRPMHRVVSYDIEAGEIVRNVIDRRDNHLPDPNNPGEYLQQTVRGKVTVEWLDDA